MINIRHSLLLTLCLPSFVYVHPVTNQESDETVKDSPLSDEDLKTFKMTGEFGLIATTGNTDTSTFKGKITAHHELEHWSNDYQLEGFYKQETSEDENGHDDTDVSAEKYFGSVQANSTNWITPITVPSFITLIRRIGSAVTIISPRWQPVGTSGYGMMTLRPSITVLVPVTPLPAPSKAAI